MSDGVHRVRRLRWKIRLGSREEAFTLRPRLAEAVTASIVPELERTFDALATGGQVVHIERLEVTIQVAGTDALEEDTVGAIRAALTARLEASSASDRGPLSSPVKRATLRSSKLESLLHYLETGALPWFAEPETPDPDHVRELEETAVSDMAEVLQRLPVAPAETGVFLFRLLSLLPESAWVSVVHAVARHRHRQEEPALVEAVERIATAPQRSSARHARLELAAAIIAGWFAPVERADKRSSPIKTAVSSDAIRLFDRLALPTRLAQPIDGRPPSSDLWKGHEEVSSSAGEDAVEVRATFGLLVFYAGLALLGPFIPRLFAARNVAHPGETALSPEAARRAAALLHFAATGEENGHEYELGFIKILLGVPIDRPILFASGILSRGDREHVETLLIDVVEHWQIPKHSLSDGLRNAFLQRRGLLSGAGSSWHLRVESAPIDALLEQLPWNLSTISLPWLARPVTIDWRRA
jgi:hypothetical protein